MKSKYILTGILLWLALAVQAQIGTSRTTGIDPNQLAPTEQFGQHKKYSISAGFGYYLPLLSEKNVGYQNAEYSPEIGLGISYFISLDYALTQDLFVGVGFNGSYATARFIKNANLNGEQINGYLKAGALENSNFLLNLTYAPSGNGWQPYAKLGVGFFKSELELGDIPLRLTNNVESELFPDYKASGLGILPEIGLKYKQFALSSAYALPFKKLTGEENPEPGAFPSTGTIKSHGLQVNASYRIYIFRK
ncbi:hypothetical protein [Rufibacter sp. LB8]|uniref:hypothetical protein n=1 Tax=Rufibacter sp. LB8 TaxID=2777781 RepID=UPI00178C4C45|nr:hypothetical protein [Rufibacter sp. LB8]